MEITGKIIAVLPLQSGVSQRTGNQWASQQFVLQTDERFPQKCVFKVFGMDRLQQFAIQMGETLTVQYSVDANENNGKWFGENNAYNIIRAGVQQPMQQMSQSGYVQQPQMQQMQNPMQQGYQQVQSPLPPQQPMQQPMQQMPPQAQNPFPPQQPAPAQAMPPQQPQMQAQAPQGQQGKLPF